MSMLLLGMVTLFNLMQPLSTPAMPTLGPMSRNVMPVWCSIGVMGKIKKKKNVKKGVVREFMLLRFILSVGVYYWKKIQKPSV